MKETLGLLFLVLLVSYGTVMLLYFRKLRVFLSILEKDEKETWIGLGSPTLFLNSSPKNSMAVVGFLLTNKFQNIDNVQLAKVGSNARNLLIAGFIMFPVMLVLPMLANL